MRKLQNFPYAIKTEQPYKHQWVKKDSFHPQTKTTKWGHANSSLLKAQNKKIEDQEFPNTH